MPEARPLHDTDAAQPVEGRPRAAPVAVGDVILGKYRIERLLGSGAMGIVMAATHLALGERVALKVLAAAALGTSRAARFEREARAAARIRSEHVARVMDVGALEGGIPFIVMEYLDGEPLSHAIQMTAVFPIEDTVQIAVEIGHALAAAHAVGIVHRDLKPSNLFLARQLDGSNLIKVLDFGVSKMPDGDSPSTRLTAASTRLGSPHYMSPEQIQSSRDVDSRADIWSLGVILYELLCGRRPFEAETRSDVFVRISVDAPVSVRALRPDVPAEVEAVILGCLEKDPQRRIASVAEVARRLAPFGHSRAQMRAQQIERIAASKVVENSLEPIAREGAQSGTRSDTASDPVPSGEQEASAENDAAGESATDLTAEIPPEAATDPRIGTTLAGRFQLVRCIGRGKMGIVYEASDGSGEKFAIKLIPPDAIADSAARARLLQEAKAASQLSHENVVRLLQVDTDSTDGHPFLVMELLRGQNLQELLEEVGALPPITVARIFLQVCRGLGAAHARSLVHRDIKPANLFLHEPSEGEIVVKICDFGIAKQIDAGTLDASARALTQTGFMLGSPAYMSPEQIKNPSRIDGRADLYSLCVSMYEALSGKHPRSHCSTVGELIVAVCTEDAPPLDEAAPWVHRGLVEIVHRGLRRALDERWQSAEELASALRPFAGNQEQLTREMLAGLSEVDRAAGGARVLPSRHGRSVRRGLVIGVAVAGAVVSSAVWVSLSRTPPRPLLTAEMGWAGTVASHTGLPPPLPTIVTSAPPVVTTKKRPAVTSPRPSGPKTTDRVDPPTASSSSAAASTSASAKPQRKVILQETVQPPRGE